MSWPIEIVMSLILVSLCGVVGFLISLQSLRPDAATSSTFLAAKTNPEKREFEVWALIYTVVWILLFGVVVATQAFESFTEHGYMAVCTTLCAPYLLQPIVWPLKAEASKPLVERYSFKANVWVALFAFIGSYWYTHYFYCVLGAKYLFPAHRLNDVPIALYFAAHFYFVTYHTFSNMLLRAVESRYAAGIRRTVLFWTVVCVFAYFTAFMETLTISAFPYYAFDDRYTAYTLGSAFYGLYFLVSFPVFYRVDESESSKYSLYQTVMEACGAGMLVLCLLDFCRIYCGIELSISGVAYYLFKGNK